MPMPMLVDFIRSQRRRRALRKRVREIAQEEQEFIRRVLDERQVEKQPSRKPLRHMGEKDEVLRRWHGHNAEALYESEYATRAMAGRIALLAEMGITADDLLEKI